MPHFDLLVQEGKSELSSHLASIAECAQRGTMHGSCSVEGG